MVELIHVFVELCYLWVREADEGIRLKSEFQRHLSYYLSYLISAILCDLRPPTQYTVQTQFLNAELSP